MRRAMQVGMATVAASAALAGGVAFATGQGSGPPVKKGSHHERFTLIGVVNDRVAVNAGDSAVGPGDYSVFRYDLFAEGKKQTKVGDAFAICFSQFPPAAFQCDIVAKLDGRGQIMLTGVTGAEISEDFTFAVTGGTDDFRNARGEVSLELVSAEPFVQRATYDLIGVR
jgi:hypothetical protein